LSTYNYAGGSPLNRIDPLGLFSLSPAVIEQALARAGLAEAAGLGPEDPFADIAAAIAIVATVASASDTTTPQSNVVQFPQQPNASNGSKSCPPDDFCTRNAQRLNAERNLLIDAQALGVPMGDAETLIAINNNIITFNREVASHNKICPQLRVPPLPTLGQRGLL
jgi:hypothetical protein